MSSYIFFLLFLSSVYWEGGWDCGAWWGFYTFQEAFFIFSSLWRTIPRNLALPDWRCGLGLFHCSTYKVFRFLGRLA